jgi:hypothetical protein
MLKEYEDLRLDLGSIQYLGAARTYDEIHTGEDLFKPNPEIKKILKDPSVFKREMLAFFENVYKIYTEVRLAKSLKDIDEELQNASHISDWNYEWAKEDLHENPLRFPVKVTEDTDLIKLAIIEWFDYVRNQAWDLWSAVNYLYSFLDSTGKYDYTENTYIGEFLYLLKQVYGFDDAQIQKIAGDFDT